MCCCRDVEWETWVQLASSLLHWRPGDTATINSLVAKFQSGSYAQQVEALQLLAKTEPDATTAASIKPVIFEAFCKATTTKTRPDPIAPELASVLGVLKAEGSEIVAKYASILRGADGECQFYPETGDLRAAVLRSMAVMDTPPVSLKADVYAAMYNAEGEGGRLLWEPAALALRALLDEDLERDPTERSSKATELHTLASATQHLEGWLSLMNRSGDRESTKAAAAAITALREPSDVLAAYLLSKVGEEPIDERQLSRCIHLRDVGLVNLLVSKLVTMNVEQRQCALSVVEQLEITEDYQAYTVLSALRAGNSATSFLSRGVLEYFRACQQRNPRWKLPEKLHLLLLRQLETEKNCIDLQYILKELGLSGALEHVNADALNSSGGGASTEQDAAGQAASVGSDTGKAGSVRGGKLRSLTGGLKGIMDGVMGTVEDEDAASSFDVYASFS